MKAKILFILLFCSLYSKAQNKKWIESYTTKWEKFEGGTKAIVDNYNFAPITFILDYNPINLTPDKPNGTYVVVPARTQGFTVVTFKTIDKKKGWKFQKGNTKVYFGNLTDTEYDEDFVYDLPFEKGKSEKVGQGYNGATSHQEKKAIDFSMKINSKIFACRDGVVIDLMRTNSKNCAEPSCAKFNNFIKILHSDGTIMQYVHLKKFGVRVKLGQKIKKGQLIGFSGNTGWSTGPHLHIDLYLINKHNKYQTLNMKFRINSGEVINELKEKVIYTKNY